MPTLYEIETEISMILGIPDDQLSEEEKANVDQYLNMLADQEAEKVDNASFLIQEWKSRADFFKEQAALMSAKQKAFECRIERLKSLYKDIMLKNSLTHIPGQKFTIRLQKNSTPTLNVSPDVQLPEKYYTVPQPELMKSVVVKDLKSGHVIPGASLEYGVHLRIG